MAEQLSLPLSFEKKGASFLRGGAKRYAQKKGLRYSDEGLDQIQASGAFQHAAGRFYEESPSIQDKRTQQSYEALNRETSEQFDYLTKPRTAGGLGVQVSFEPELEGSSIYPSHEDLIKDVTENRRLRVNQAGSDPGDQSIGHPLMDNEATNRFRAVHDAFGHAAVGRSFSRHGEEAAYHSHAQMFSEDAVPALTAETRMQNSAMNFGPKTEGFPEQKTMTPPDWAMAAGTERRTAYQPRPTRSPKNRQLGLTF